MNMNTMNTAVPKEGSFFLLLIALSVSQHYNMVMAAAAAASASEDHDLLLNRFLPYSSSQLFLDAPGTPVSSSGSAVHAALNVNRSNSNSSSSSSLPTIPRSSSDIYSSIPDIISLDWSTPSRSKQTPYIWCWEEKKKRRKSEKKKVGCLFVFFFLNDERLLCTENKYIFSFTFCIYKLKWLFFLLCE